MDTTQEQDQEGGRVFSTRDIYLATTLVTLKFHLLSIDLQIEGTKSLPIGYFKFEETPDLKKTKIAYNQGEILVEPRIFVNNLRALKADVINMIQNPNNLE